ncbi:non-homologous end joining protein Ku [Cellulomonas alba]|uniref:Non-homologous end joining protein Ku n=1 Tax=Cellulomonas alba TaxID=3053467 RepID=A0ABT7SAX0_9CELL|nr:Ku protein [Cellulomonas alba]MDM7853323.1 Ku protein [Cellulomonas alba]
MRAIWKGAVAFGLVNVPVKLYAATGEHEVTLHQVHAKDGGRIRYKRTCSLDGETVEYAEIAKGYETDDGELVVLTDEDLARLPLATEREIEVLEFVPAEQVDPMLLGKSYYLEPEKTAAKPYALLRGALEQADRMAVVKVALRQRESMAVLRVRDKVIVLQTLLWPDEVREAEFPILDGDVSVRPQELAMAASLVDSLAADFDPSQYSDRYEAALESLIEEKVSAGHTQAVPVPAEEGSAAGSGGGEVVDLLAALQRSVEKARTARGESGGEAETASPPKGKATRTAAKDATTADDGEKPKKAKANAAKTAEAVEPAEPETPAPRRRRKAS